MVKKPSFGPNFDSFGPNLSPNFFRVFYLHYVIHCYKLSSYAISRKTNEPNLRKWQKTDHLGHNILELYDVLVQVRFTTCKTKRDIYYNKRGIPVALLVTEQLKT